MGTYDYYVRVVHVWRKVGACVELFVCVCYVRD